MYAAGASLHAAPHASALVVAAVLLAALLHASWNAAAHRISDGAVAFTLIGVSCTAAGALLVPWAAVPAARAWPFLLGSVTCHTAYNLLLMRSYRLGDFNQMYPLARGVSPLVVALVAVTLVGQPLRLWPGVGVVAISVGLAVLVFAGSRPTGVGRAAVVAAVLTGLFIATYTVLDGVGVRLSDSTLGYIGWLFLLQGPVTPLILLAWRGRGLLAASKAHRAMGLASGVVSVSAYGLVIWAQTRSGLASVAALREVSILFGAVIGAIVFRERFGTRRVVGAALVVAGVLLVTT